MCRCLALIQRCNRLVDVVHVSQHGTDVLQMWFGLMSLVQMCECGTDVWVWYRCVTDVWVSYKHVTGLRGQYRCFGNVVQMFECDTDVVQVCGSGTDIVRACGFGTYVVEICRSGTQQQDSGWTTQNPFPLELKPLVCHQGVTILG